MTAHDFLVALLGVMTVPFGFALAKQSTNALVGLFVLIFLVLASTLGLIAVGVDKDVLDASFGVLWFLTACGTYYHIAIKNRDRFVLHTKLTKKGGKGPDRSDKFLLFVFGPYFLWSHNLWPNLMKRLARKPLQPRKNV